jgi:glycosyltransferase involved in cell wall biosynthesis
VTADICLLVEGTYPYATGGVASWLHDLVANLPDLSFSVVHFGSRPEPRREAHYQLPANVESFHEMFIHDHAWEPPRRGSRLRASDWEKLRDFHRGLLADRPFDKVEVVADLHRLATRDGVVPELIHAPQSWDLLVDLYHERIPELAFPDFFWTFRFTHLPIFYLLEKELPAARLYHAVSAGYNGFAGALAKRRTGTPLVLTEHGIYARERAVEIAQADWIYTDAPVAAKPPIGGPAPSTGYFHEWWLDMFRFITKFTYDAADCIVSITEANRRYQLEYGADPKKLKVIPNGIPVDRLVDLRHDGRDNGETFVVSFVGRVVPIKDVITFIRAIRYASTMIPKLVAYIVGPIDEDPDYVDECRREVSLLQLDDMLRFTGPADVREHYRRTDAVVLTSLSEAQPLVVIEANCAGIPVVTSDVGDCDRLVLGANDEDRALGPSGLLTAPASPEATGDALARLWRDPGLRREMGRAGRKRATRYYRQESMFEAYRELYGEYLDSPGAVTQ